MSIRCSSDFGWQLMVDPWDVRGKDCVCAPVLLVDGAVRPGWSHCVGGGLPHCQQQLAVVLFMATPVESIQLLSTCAPCSFAPYRLGAIVWAMHTAGVSMAHTLAWLEIVTHDRGMAPDCSTRMGCLQYGKVFTQHGIAHSRCVWAACHIPAMQLAAVALYTRQYAALQSRHKMPCSMCQVQRLVSWEALLCARGWQPADQIASHLWCGGLFQLVPCTIRLY